MNTKLKQLLAELKKLQDDHKGKAMPEDVAAKFETLAAEAKAIQDLEEAESKRAEELNEMDKKAKATKTVVNPTLPEDKQEPEEESRFAKPAGYMTFGDYIAAQKGIQDFIKAGMPRAPFLLGVVGGMLRTRHGRKGFIQLSAEQVAQIKAVPTIGDTVIDPTLVPDLVRVTEHDQLGLRDVLDISSTTSDAVKFIRIVDYTRAAATVAPSAPKPQAALELDAQTQPVRTIAVWMPVENQQLADLPALRGIIDNELLYDVNKHVEELVIYGDGAGENFSGIVPDPLVPTMRSEGGDTLIDISRRGITDVRRAGFDPNAIVVDPLDWEEIVLEKGTDNRYVWVIVTEAGVQRLWGVPVIETVAMSDFAGNATEARNMIVGDFRRGATLWDREAASVQVGWINDQFIKNQRTLLCELRAAFGVKRPLAFRKYETQAAVAS